MGIYPKIKARSYDWAFDLRKLEMLEVIFRNRSEPVCSYIQNKTTINDSYN